MSNVVRLEYAYGVCPKCKSVHLRPHLRYLIRNDGLTHKPYEIKCINCNSYFTKEDIWGRGEETAPKPITNADRIRAMIDEELDKFLGEVQWDVANYCGGVTQKQEYPVPEQRGAWLDWLKQEVKDK